MGMVWKAWDTRLERPVALKRVLPSLADSPDAVYRFLEEARAVAKLIHPNIVQIYRLESDEQGDFIEMEFVDGLSVLQQLRQTGKYAVVAAAELICQICQGLAAAHACGIIHRDIKPANILVNAAGVPKLADFGLARASRATSHTLSGQALGTDGFMAPEQEANAKDATAASDQFSVGATLYQMLTGRSPRRLDFRLVPPVLTDVLARALEEDPADRYASIADFRNALAAAAGVGGLAMRPAVPMANGSLAPAETKAAPATPVKAGIDGGDLAELIRKTQLRVAEKHAAAKRLMGEFQDAAALELLAEVPEHLRDQVLETQARTRHEQATKLEHEISQRGNAIKLDGLRALVDQFLQIYPHRKDMELLRTTLPAETKAAIPKLLVAPFTSEVARRAQEDWARRLGKPVEFTNSIGMKFRLIPPGEFLMGEADGTARNDDEKPQHLVRISQPYYLGVYPVTQAEYAAVLKTNPSHFKGNDRLPVENVSWDDTQGFLKTLMQRESGTMYRLPREAEWEYACRAGTTTPYWFGSALNGKQDNCNGNYPHSTSEKGPYLQKTSVVGQYPANPFGLYDLHGNVWEWCQDGKRDYGSELVVDPMGPDSPGSLRCLRGGSWCNCAVYCRSALRNVGVPAGRGGSIGFRVLLGVV